MSLRYTIGASERVALLRRLLHEKGHLRFIEVHSGISVLIAQELRLELKDGALLEFDGFWESSLTDSASKGMPDIEVVGMDSRIATIDQILAVSSKPMIVDGDTGGDASQFEYTVRRLERLGVSMVIIEDKVFPKRNSLEAGASQALERKEVFAEKIRRGVLRKQSPDFMVVARLESLIAGMGISDALERAWAYLLAGADGLMIHSKQKDPTEILEFAQKYHELPESLRKGKVLVCVPTTYNTIRAEELFGHGFDIVIHANHLLRASHKAMEDVCRKILLNDRSFEVESDISPVSQIFERVGFLDVKRKDQELAEALQPSLRVIIPAAGAGELARDHDMPIGCLDIGGKTLLARQVESLSRAGLTCISVVRGYRAERFHLENVKYVEKPDYATSGIASSLFAAEEDMQGAFVMVNGDVWFSEGIIRSLLEVHEQGRADVVLVVDSSYTHHRHNVDKQLDVVRTKGGSGSAHRQVIRDFDEEVAYIGKKLGADVAQYEFVGMAYFSARGAEILRDVYRSLREHPGPFHEAESFAMAGFTDLIQELVNRGYSVKVLKVFQGWMEIHQQRDVELARQVAEEQSKKREGLSSTSVASSSVSAVHPTSV